MLRQVSGTFLLDPRVSLVRLSPDVYSALPEQAREAEKESRAAVVSFSSEARAKAAGLEESGAPGEADTTGSEEPDGERPGRVATEATDRRATTESSRRIDSETSDPRPPDGSEAPDDGTESARSSTPKETPNELTEGEQRQVDELRARDREVRAHEQAHKAAGGQYAGSIHYDYQTGPDGKKYAVGGHVPIDVSEVPNDPDATIQKMNVVRRAALAPAEPSSADRQVAATAAQKSAEARADKARTQFSGAETGATEEATSAASSEATGKPTSAAPTESVAVAREPVGAGFGREPHGPELHRAQLAQPRLEDFIEHGLGFGR